MCDCFSDHPEVYTKKTRTARVVHRCAECTRVIQPGEAYEYTFGVWGNRADSFHTCAHCVAAVKVAGQIIDCNCWSHGEANNDLLEYARNHDRGKPGERFRLYRLALCMIRKWQNRRGYRRLTSPPELLPVPAVSSLQTV